jgi:hypothetical protein
MEVTADDVARIPVGNLRVPREEFARVWLAAERRSADRAASGVTDWYAGGVLATCRWIATAAVRPPRGPRRPARAPLTRTTTVAYEELIEQEYLAAELVDVRRPDLIGTRPGWCEGIRATLRWAWRHAGPPPLDHSSEMAGVDRAAGHQTSVRS